MRQTLEEIRAAYPREWVLMVDCEYDDSRRLVAATVLAHSPHRKDIYIKQSECDYDHCAIEYTGPFPEDLRVALRGFHSTGPSGRPSSACLRQAQAPELAEGQFPHPLRL